MESQGGLVAAGAAVVPVEGDIAVGQGADEPAEADGHGVVEAGVGVAIALDTTLVLLTEGHGRREGIA